MTVDVSSGVNLSSIQRQACRLYGKITESKKNVAVAAVVTGVALAWMFRGEIYRALHSDIGSWFFGKNVTKAVAIGTIGSTMSIDQKEAYLPQLPVPKLEDTAIRFLATRKPLLSDGEYRELEALVERFLKGNGPKLQALLEGYSFFEGRHQDYTILLRPVFFALATWFGQRLNTDYNSGWFEPIWMKVAYLKWRSPLFFTNWFSPGTDLDITVACAKGEVQTQKAAYAIKGFLKHMGDILHDRGNYAREASLQMSVGQYERVFGSYQVPGEEMDFLKHNFSKRTGVHSDYVLVVCKGFYFPMQVFHRNGREYSIEEIHHQLLKIKGFVEATSEPPSQIGILTADNRTIWARNRALILENPIGRSALEKLEGALFPLFLDETHPKSVEERSLLAHCQVHNRVFGYAMGPIVFANGNIAIVNTHSPGEAHIVALAGEAQIDYLASKALEVTQTRMTLPEIKTVRVALPEPEPLDFSSCFDATRTVTDEDVTSIRDLVAKHKLEGVKEPVSGTTTSLRDEIIRVSSVLTKLGGDLDVNYFDFIGFGTNQIKKWGLSPDTFFQVAIQLAWYELTGSFKFTYQTGTTRLFKYGRTETIHPVSMAMKAFVTAFSDKGIEDEEKKRLLQEVMRQHRVDKEDAMSGRGSNRHLIALNVVAAIKGIKEELFESPHWQTPLTIATSQTPFRVGVKDRTSTPFKDGGERENDGGGFVPYDREGIGLSYKMKRDAISWFLTTWKSNHRFNSERMSLLIANSLHALEMLLRD